MAEFFWFLVAVLFLILFLHKKSGGGPEDYRHGYWDGYRAFGDKVKAELDEGHVDRAQLEAFIAEGYPQSVQSVETAEVEEENIPPVKQVATTTMSQPAVELTPEQREQRTVRNLNAILYVASFLLVAAAAVFVATNMPATIRLLGIWAVVILFYGAGLALHQNMPRLKPAAIAFLGTGLAILPFAGYALHLIGDIPGQTAWLITSVLGLVAYFTAAIVIKSQLVSYLTMAFVLSLALSSAAAMSASIVWYFILLIGVSLLAASLAFLKPTWLPEVFRQPIEATGQLVTPIALLASLVVYDHMSLALYELVFGVATLHYVVVWLQTRSWVYETIVRTLAHGTLLLIVFDIADQHLPTFAAYWLVIAALQSAFSLVRLQPQSAKSRRIELVWLGVMQAVILGGSVLWAGSEYVALGTLASFATIGVISVLTTLRVRQVAWAIPALVVSLVAPFIVGRWLAYPVWEWQIIGWIFIIAALGVVIMYYLVREQRSAGVWLFLQTSFWLYLGFSILTTFGQLDTTAIGLVAMAATGLAIAFSYIIRHVSAEVVGGLLFVLALAFLLAGDASNMWYITTVVLLSAGSLYAASIIHHFLRQIGRRNVILTLAQAVLVGLLFNFGAEKQVVTTSLVLLVVAAAMSFTLRVATRQKSSVLQQIFTSSYAAYALLAWLLSFGLESYWALLVYVVVTLLFWAGSYIERLPGLVIGGNIAFVAAIISLWDWLGWSSEWMIFGVAWTTATVLYVAYWLLSKRQDLWRYKTCLISVWVLLGSASLMQFMAGTQAQEIAAAGTLVALALTVVTYGYLQHNRSVMELGVYLGTFGAQRMAGLFIPELNLVAYAHWWAIVIGFAAWWRQAEGNFKNRLIVAVAFITAGTGFTALGEGGWYQLLFLFEHAVLLVTGALKQTAWALWWGVVAVIVAVLYFLRDYPYMVLAFLGLVLIAIVIWRLARADKGHKES